MRIPATSIRVVVFLLCGGCLVLPVACKGCDLEEVKLCTQALTGLIDLKPIQICAEDVRTCLQNLPSCSYTKQILSTLTYICNTTTGVADLADIVACLDPNPENGYALLKDQEDCLSKSGWDNKLPAGTLRCSSAKNYSSCLNTASLKYCNSQGPKRFYDKTKKLFIGYGCLPAAAAEGNMLAPCLCMMSALFGIALKDFLFKS